MHDKGLLLKRGFLFIVLAIFYLTQLAPTVIALSDEQRALFNKNIRYFDLQCTASNATVASTPGTGSESGATFPNLPPQAMANGINKYIEKTNANSQLLGLGTTIVASAENSNVNPFLIVAIAQKESGLAGKDDFNVKNGNNSFGRSATSSQPNFQGSRLWYKWSSVKASLDHTATENLAANSGGDFAKYLRDQYGDKIDNETITDIMNAYAPPAENDTEQYVTDINKWTKEMADLTKSEGGEPTQLAPDSGNLVTPEDTSNSSVGDCQPCPADGTAGVSGGTLSANVPEPWRELINNASTKTESTSAEANLVAAVLYVENRGWPEYKKDWATSSASAAGAFQFIPSTWASMGRDGDGDGRKDANNPKDAVLAAFIHHKGSKGKPIAKNGYSESRSPEENFETAVLNRDDSNLLAFAAKYNGSGAPDNTKLKDFPRNENSDYVKMAYWLLATDFKKSYDPATGQTKDAASGSAASGKSESADAATGCNTIGEGGDGTTIGDYAIPVPKKYWESNPEWFTKPHHTYPAADIPVPSNTNLYSVTSGTVKSVGNYGTAGFAVNIEYNGATIGYYHGTPGTGKVKAGDSVRAGQLLMLSGYSGRVKPAGPSGAHLHLDIELGGQKRCPQTIFKALKSNQTFNFDELPTSGCVGAS